MASIRTEDLRDFHDAELVSLALDRAAGRVDLVFLVADGTQGRFACEGVLNIKSSGLLFQNVAYGISVTPVTTLTAEETRRIIGWSYTLDNKMAIPPDALTAYVDDVLAGKLQLLHVTPSWGAELAVLCKSVVLRNEARASL